MSRVREDVRALTGPERAAVMILSLGEEHAVKMFAMLDDEEIKELSQTMAISAPSAPPSSSGCSSTSPTRSRPPARWSAATRAPSASSAKC